VQVEVFTESPFKPDTTLRFVFNPNKKLNSWAIDSRDDPYQECKTVLVPHTVKDRVDSIFQKVIGSPVKDFVLDRTYGEWDFSAHRTILNALSSAVTDIAIWLMVSISKLQGCGPTEFITRY
jgi:hypothetical protein